MTKLKLPPFGTLLGALNEAGVETKSARGFWGGITSDDDIVVTFWQDEACELGRARSEPEDGDRWPVWCPRTNHGRLKEAWETGRMVENATVRAIMVQARCARCGVDARPLENCQTNNL